MESHSVFSLITRLCEIFLESEGLKDSGNSRVVLLKKLRTTSYGLLLKPLEKDFSDDPHESFVSAVSAHIRNRIELVENNSEEFDKCVDHLWSETSKRPYLASVVYFLSKVHNENFSLGVESQKLHIGTGGSWIPKQYQLYHPSSFILPKLEDYAGRETNFLCSSSIPAFLPNQAALLPPLGLQLNFGRKKEENQRRGSTNQLMTFMRHTKNAGEGYNYQVEDEGYVSHGATPLGVSPGGWCGMPWDDIGILDNSYEKKEVHHTWETLGEALPARELPSLMEAGPKALNCQLKIQECMILTMEPTLWAPPKHPTSWHSFFQQIMYLIIGVESECFTFNKKSDAFELLSGTWVEGLSHEALSLYSKDFLVMGTCFRRMTSVLEQPLYQDSVDGVVQLAIWRSIKTYLNLYSGACMVVMHNLLKQNSLSFLLVKSKIRVLQLQIIGLARAFGKWGGSVSIPNGVGALGHLHRHASGAQKKELVYLLRYILNSACRSYFNLLEKWVYNGEVVDEDDFFVTFRKEYINHRSRRYWTRAFSVNPALVPEFLCGLESLLLRCGKSVHFLKLCDPKNAVLEESLNLEILKAKEEADQDEVIVQGTPMEEMRSVVHTNVDSSDKRSNNNLIQDLQDNSAVFEEETITPQNLTTENPSDDAVLTTAGSPKEEDSSKDLEPLSASTSSKEEERFNAVRETIIEEYLLYSEAAEKRQKRAEWRKRRLQLRTNKKSPSESYQTQTELQPTLSQDVVELIAPETPLTQLNTEDTPSATVQSEFQTERVADVEKFSPAPVDSENSVKGASHIPGSSPPNTLSRADTSSAISRRSEEEINGEEMEDFDQSGGNSNGSSEKPNNLPSITVSIDSPEISSLENVVPRADSAQINAAVKSDAGQDPVQGEEALVCGGSDDVGDCVETNDKTSDTAGSDSNGELFLNLMSFPLASELVSPRRTPLKKVEGLFSYPEKAVATAEEESIQAGEAEQLDWPFRPVLVSLIDHSRKVDKALLRWLLVDKGLASHLHSLRSYFFLLDGEFGRRLSEDLFSAMRPKPGKKPSVECLNAVTLNSILSHALASSTHAISDPNASLLTITLRALPAQASAFEQLSSIQMVYDAPWPVNVVLTDEALSKYSRVLDLLLRLKYASWALEDVFMNMRIMDPLKGDKQALPGGWSSPPEAFLKSPQYRALHIYRHQMLNLIRSVQSYITAEVLQASGKKLEEAINHATCLDEFYSEHVSYVKRILFECLLNKRAETISTILNDILKLIMKFHWSSCSRSWIIHRDPVNSENFTVVHPNYSVLTRIHSAFQDMTDFLLKYAWRLANHGYQAHLSTLLLMVNANNYYKLESGCEGSGKDSEVSGPPG
ncbi:gamma-tubulin complex component 6 [Ischnura elegans]|uniref:gamma-tubulin complex component 6 n=1 Tax=Ischnura elegans TaxID=197161 RepID=UPI001ED897BE|nr:gamma-tubulin complex component 6 [Ischnura elegans]